MNVLSYLKQNKWKVLILILLVLIYLFRYEIKYTILELLRYRSKSPGVEAKLKEVHPILRYKISFVIREAEKNGEIVKITSAHRNPVHNASVGGAKYSCHIPRSAVDMNIGNLRMASPKSAWKPYVDIAKAQGLRWGGDFSGYYDPVHFDIELEKGYSCQEEILDPTERLVFGKFARIW